METWKRGVIIGAAVLVLLGAAAAGVSYWAHLVEEALGSDADVLQIWTHSEFKNEKIINTKNIPHQEISEKELKKISDTVHNQGIVALLKLPEEISCEMGENKNWVYLDEVRDPGNLGTILRTSDWFGVKQVALSPKCVDPYNPKVVRGGMGAHFHLKIHTEVDLKAIKEMGHTVIAADPKGVSSEMVLEESFGQVSSYKKWCLVLGSEVHGISKEIKPLVDQFVAIPGRGKAESLNVAVAAGILLFILSGQSK